MNIVKVVAILAVIQLLVQPGQAITCGQVDAALAPCIPYLTGGGEPSGACCGGVKAIQGMAQTTADKRACCTCVKAAANRYANLKDDAAQALPMKCGVSMDIPVSRSVNCEMSVLPFYIL
ncbi:non-specific lipid-transfer protein A-like [Olea europaea var. sylvestris]|uniref:non-specific lipid-transfer protein A-like n=1 Tax=Olea europaea var. sylvestris TaxID=158386 RepID=UPI000C1D746E|nr:non-specific lipid-transfer protein A-like [Olea europaea var. sylvestris]